MASRRRSARFSYQELVFIVLVVVSGTMLAFNAGGFVVSFQQVGFTVLSSLQKGVHAVTSGIGGTVNAVHELSRLREENLALTEQLRNYEYMQRTNTEIRRENERLREQLAFSQSVEQRNFPAQIIARAPDHIYSALTIDKGVRHGIKKNMPVIAIQGGTVGLVGKVVSVGVETSMVMPVYDLKNSVSARIQNTRDLGLVSGLGSSDMPLTMRYIKKRVLDELHIGDLVVTSGESENYPRDIPIGSISRITVLDYDSSLDIEITPVVDFSRLENVLVTDLKHTQQVGEELL